VRGLRRNFPGVGDLTWRKGAVARFLEHDLDPDGLVARLRERPAATALSGA